MRRRSAARRGERVRVEISSSHYARRERAGVILDWRVSGIDALGRILPELARGGGPIPYPARRVVPAAAAEFSLPAGSCRCSASSRWRRGRTTARPWRIISSSSSFRRLPARAAGTGGRRDAASRRAGRLVGGGLERAAGQPRGGRRARTRSSGWGTGFFEWALPMDGLDLRATRRLRVLVEASSCRRGHSADGRARVADGTGDFAQRRAGSPERAAEPSARRARLAELPARRPGRVRLPDARGGRRRSLRRVADGGGPGHLRLRCAVPAGTLTPGGLVIYGPESGRYPFGLTVLVER